MLHLAIKKKTVKEIQLTMQSLSKKYLILKINKVNDIRQGRHSATSRF